MFRVILSILALVIVSGCTTIGLPEIRIPAPTGEPPISRQVDKSSSLYVAKVVHLGNAEASCRARIDYRNEDEDRGKVLYLEGTLIYGLPVDETGLVSFSRSDSRWLVDYLEHAMRFEGFSDFDSSSVADDLLDYLKDLDGEPCRGLRELEKRGDAVGELFVGHGHFPLGPRRGRRTAL